MESYSHPPLSLVCPTKTGSLGGPALSNPSQAPLGSQWAISTVLLVDHPKPVAAHLLDHQRVTGPFEDPQVRQPIPSGLSFSYTSFWGSPSSQDPLKWRLLENCRPSGAGEIAQQLRTLAVLSKTSKSLSSSHIRCLKLQFQGS